MMVRELLILRHGKSDWKTGQADFDRPLTSRGNRGAQRIGAWLQQQNLIPDYVLTSPAMRALKTTEKVCKASVRGTQDLVFKDSRMYLASAQTLKQVLNECPADARRVMLVGHNPGLENLVVDLADRDVNMPADGKLLATATLAHLEIHTAWNSLKSNCGTLTSIIRASNLPSE